MGGSVCGKVHLFAPLYLSLSLSVTSYLITALRVTDCKTVPGTRKQTGRKMHRHVESQITYGRIKCYRMTSLQSIYNNFNDA